MSTPRALDKQTPQTRNTVHSTDKTVTLYLQDDCTLLLNPKSAPYPYVIDVQTVHALANLLIAEYKSITKEASKYNGIFKAGRSKERDTGWSNWS